MNKKRILILGAGKAGQEYTVHLLRLGHEVTLYARESQKPELMTKGLNYFDKDGRERFEIVPEEIITSSIDAALIYDHIFILFRGDQLEAAELLLRPLKKGHAELIIGIPVWSFEKPKIAEEFKSCLYMLPKKGNAIRKEWLQSQSDSSPTTFGRFGNLPTTPESESVMGILRENQSVIFDEEAQSRFDHTLVFALPLLLGLGSCGHSIINLTRNTSLLKDIAKAQDEARALFSSATNAVAATGPFYLRTLYAFPASIRPYLFKLLRLILVGVDVPRVEDHFRMIEGQTLYLTRRLILSSEKKCPHLSRLSGSSSLHS